MNSFFFFFSQKLNFSEDEGTVDEDAPTLRNTERKSDRRDRWEKDRGRDIGRESEERREVSREPERESAMREKNPQGSRERDNRRDVAEERRDRDRRFSPGDPERWQHRGGFDYRGGSGRDYGGPQNSGNRGCPPQHVQAHTSPHTVPANTSVHPPSRPPSLTPVHPPTHQLAHAPSLSPSSHPREEEDSWRDKRVPGDEVQVALERARQRHEEEEKRYEEKKRFEQNKVIKKSRDPRVFDEREREEPDAVRERSRGSSESRDDKPPSRDGRDYRQHPDRRENYRDSYRDHPREQYDRPFDRRDGQRDSQPVFSSQFKSKLPPRFQKQQQQQEMMRAGGGGQPFRGQNSQAAPLFEPRFGSNAGGRFMNRDNESKWLNCYSTNA